MNKNINEMNYGPSLESSELALRWLSKNNNKLFFHKKLFMKRWFTQKCSYYSSHNNTYSTVKPGICGNKKEIRGIWGLRNYHRESVVGG